MKKIFFAIIAFSLLAIGACSPKQEKQNKAKYVFLFIGDGMGVNQVYLTELFLGVKNDSLVDEKLIFNQFPVNSNMTTYSRSGYITCSSAAATAMSTGVKTKNGIVCKSPDLDINYETFSQKAKEGGYKVGIVSSVSIDHATPACFYAQQNSRNEYYEISMQLPNLGVDYFGGGGFKQPKGKNKNLPDAYENAISKGYNFVNTHEKFQQLKKGDEKVFAVNPHKYKKGEFYWIIDNEKEALTLADFTQKGIELLENDKGFFMMVEGGKIDWACHANDAASMVYETIAFNDAVKTAYNFYKQHPDETLIIVTADHETGGLFNGIGYLLKPQLLYEQKISIQAFEQKIAQLKKEDKKYTFQQIMDLVTKDFGLNGTNPELQLNEKELHLMKTAYNYEFSSSTNIDPNADYLEVNEQKTVAEAATYLLNSKAGIGWGSKKHTSMPVPVRAIGSGQEYFSKYFDNTDLSKLMSKAMQLN